MQKVNLNELKPGDLFAFNLDYPAIGKVLVRTPEKQVLCQVTTPIDRVVRDGSYPGNSLVILLDVDESELMQRWTFAESHIEKQDSLLKDCVLWMRVILVASAIGFALGLLHGLLTSFDLALDFSLFFIGCAFYVSYVALSHIERLKRKHPEKLNKSAVVAPSVRH